MPAGTIPPYRWQLSRTTAVDFRRNFVPVDFWGFAASSKYGCGEGDLVLSGVDCSWCEAGIFHLCTECCPPPGWLSVSVGGERQEAFDSAGTDGVAGKDRNTQHSTHNILNPNQHRAGEKKRHSEVLRYTLTFVMSKPTIYLTYCRDTDK